MRVISGVYGGRRLTAPIGKETRPTIDRVKEAIFSSLHFDLPSSTVLDLFSGTGQMGIEALSRGAVHVDFVDSDKKSCELIRKNVESCSIKSGFSIQCSLFEGFLQRTQKKYDIVILDPPFDKNEYYTKTLLLLKERDLLNEGATITLEMDKKCEISYEEIGYKLKKEAIYSYVKILYLTKGW